MHFYKKERANDAMVFMRNTAHEFPDTELISHRKEIGLNADSVPADEEAQALAQTRKRADNFALDDEGFTVIKRR